MRIPKVLSLFDKFTAGIASVSTVLKGNESRGICFVVRNLPGGVLGVGIHSQVLEHIHAADVRKLGLHNSFKLRVLGEVQLVSVVHLFEFRHKFVQ